MKLILPIVILFLQSCLFSGSTSETPDDTRKADVANTAKDVGLDSKKMDMSDDVSKKIDASDMSSDVEDDMGPKCDPKCGENMICVGGSCVCEEGTECAIESIVKNLTQYSGTIIGGNKASALNPVQLFESSQAVLFLSARSESRDPQSAYILPRVTSDGVRLTRNGTNDDVNFVVNLVEFDKKHIEVFKGTFTLSAGEKSISTTVDPKKAFLVFYVSPLGADLTLKDTSLRGVVSKNKIEFNREEDGGVLKVHWSLIVSLGDAFEVDHVEHVIKNNQRHSALTNNDKDENALFLWSNTTTQTTYSQGHTRCQYLSADPSSGEPASTRCSRGKESDLGAGPPPDDVAITIALQKIHFQNLTVNHYEPVFGSRVSRAIKPGVRGDKDTAISGQLGSAGTVTKSASGSGSDEHPAMCTIKLATNVEGVEIIEIKRAAPKGIAQASVQHIKWY